MNKNALKQLRSSSKVKTNTGQIPHNVGYVPPIDGGYTMPKSQRDKASKEGVKKLRGY